VADLEQATAARAEGRGGPSFACDRQLDELIDERTGAPGRTREELTWLNELALSAGPGPEEMKAPQKLEPWIAAAGPRHPTEEQVLIRIPRRGADGIREASGWGTGAASRACSTPEACAITSRSPGP
jgi:hypothetical protein